MLVILPTYNERESLGEIVARLHAVTPQADVLVIDDASPDGTGELADRLAAADGRISVLHRPGKLGLGTAYLEGFEWAAARGYRWVDVYKRQAEHHVVARGIARSHGRSSSYWARVRERIKAAAAHHEHVIFVDLRTGGERGAVGQSNADCGLPYRRNDRGSCGCREAERLSLIHI